MEQRMRPARPAHVGQHFPHGADVGKQGQFVGALPRRVVEGIEGAGRRSAGVVDQGVHPAETLHGGGHQASDILGPGDVAHDVFRRHPGFRLDVGPGLGEIFPG